MRMDKTQDLTAKEVVNSYSNMEKKDFLKIQQEIYVLNEKKQKYKQQHSQ